MATKEHTFYCFDILLWKLQGNEIKEPQFENERYPLFVTWNTIKGPGEELRGCIGNFSPMELYSGLREYALTSALRDGRFSPIDINEVSSLKCSVSLLTDFEPARDWKDWQVGLHGIRMELILDSKRYSSTYLPEVASSQNWNHRETIESLLRKAGYKGNVNKVLDQLSVVRYKSSKSHATYQEYINR